MKHFLSLLLTAISINLFGQSEELPYREIPDYPEKYTPETVASRMIDGLGFRYYWVSEGLRPEDLTFKPSEDARTTRETLEHIHGLSQFILNCVRGVPHKPVDVTAWTFEELRRGTLENIGESSQKLKSGKITLEELIIQFDDNNYEFPFWNQLNGPIADAIWHCGQVVSFRRSSGNPYNSNASVFTGTVRE